MIIFPSLMIYGAYMDKYANAPTDPNVLALMTIAMQIVFMFLMPTVWFRKALILVLLTSFYLFVAHDSMFECLGNDELLNGEGDPLKEERYNSYPTVQVIPDYDTFKYGMSCSPDDENTKAFKKYGSVVSILFLTVYAGRRDELDKRHEFGKKWYLMKNKIDTEKKLKQLTEKQEQSARVKESLFGEIRSIQFKSPMKKIMATLDKVKLAVGDDPMLRDALKSIEETLESNENLNKVDIEKQDLNEKDKELAAFVMSAGGGVLKPRERIRSVSSMVKGKTGFGMENSLINRLGLPDVGNDLIEKRHDSLQLYLENFEEWSFNTFLFNDLSGGHAMYYLFLKHMERYFENYGFDLKCLKAFVLHVEDNYCFDPENENPYHTKIHAADVMQTVGCMLATPFVQKKLGGLDRITCLISSMMHDYKHKGVNNAFLVNTGDPLALLHNDSSVLERFHASEFFLLLRGHQNSAYDTNFLKGLSNADFKQLRSVTIDMILATDLSQGYNYISKFDQRIFKKEIDDGACQPEDILIIMQMLLKAADVSHPCKSLDQHKVWTLMIQNEFFSQGDQEKRLNFESISPLCDRIKNFDIPKSQTGFIDFVVSPTVTNVAKTIGLDDMLKNLKANYKYWTELQKLRSAEGTLHDSYDILKEEVGKLRVEQWDEVNIDKEGSGLETQSS